VSAVALLPRSGWSDGYPVVEESDNAVARVLEQAGLARDSELGSGVAAAEVAVQAVRAGCRPEYMPVVVAALEAVLDAAFHAEHLGGSLAAWPAFVVNGPLAAKLRLYNGPYVMAAGRRANASIGRAISLALANCLPSIGRPRAVFGCPSRMAGLVIAEREDTPWEPLHVMLGHPRESSTVTAFSSFQNPFQILPLGSRYTTATRIAALYAFNAAEGWCGPGTRMLLLSPNAQRVFLADGWSKQDLRRYLVENTKISVAQLKRLHRWNGEGAASPITLDEEQHYFRLADDALWPKLHPAPGQHQLASGVDFMPVVAGSEVAHMYTELFTPYPTPTPRPVTKTIRQP
jgi:hypothetical protein